MGFRMVIDTQPDLEVVGEASDGREAIDATQRLAPDVVLMDVRMPEMDGVEATRRSSSRARRPGSSSSPRSTSTSTSTRRCARARAASCSRTRSPPSCCPRSAPSPPATRSSRRASPAGCCPARPSLARRRRS